MPKPSLKVIEFAAKETVLNMVRAMRFAPDGSLVTVSRHREQKGPTYFARWDLEKKCVVQAMQRPESKNYGRSPSILRFAPQDGVVVTDQFSSTGDRCTEFEFRDAKTFAVKQTLRCSNPNIFTSIDWSPDETSFAVSALDGLARVWSLRKKGGSKEIQNAGYAFIGFNAAGELFGVDFDVFSINPNNGALRKRGKTIRAANLPIHVNSLDRSLLVTSALKGEATLVCTDTASWRNRSIRIGQQPHLVSLVLSPDNRLAACGYLNGTVTIWDLVAGKKIGSFKTSRKCLSCLAFSRDGKVLAGCNHYKIFAVKISNS
jgi:WD40 repeat protein